VEDEAPTSGVFFFAASADETESARAATAKNARIFVIIFLPEKRCERP
jgi:hypothetical protein